MKITKKTIIIALVVAVAAWLLWKRMKGKGAASIGDVALTSAPDTTSLNYILTHIDFNEAERKKIESLRKAAEASEMTYQTILAKANAKGRSYDQQLVCEAIWMLYNPNNNGWTNDRGWKLSEKVLNL